MLSLYALAFRRTLEAGASAGRGSCSTCSPRRALRGGSLRRRGVEQADAGCR
ncbi:MAG TPA: hypothetical protein VFS43_04145 [Polyangiaceae bacterium]|nr:hypothetical protein [Polyangiaceae bacterium]